MYQVVFTFSIYCLLKSFTILCETSWSRRFFLIFLHMRELRESREAVKTRVCSPLREKKKNQEKPLGPGYVKLEQLSENERPST